MLFALAALVVCTQVNPVYGNYYNCNDYYDNSCGFSICDCDPCNEWSIYSDWIFWRTRRCDLDYAFPSSGSTNFKGKVKSVDPCYESGFRVGLLKECGDVDFGLHYTYFSVSESDTTKDTENGFLARTRIGNPFATTFNAFIEFTKGDYDLNFNLFDLEAGYHTELTECLHGRLFGGLRFAFIDQDFDVLYAQEADKTDGDGAPVDIVKHRWDMDAYGLYFGGKTTYSLNDCFSLFGSFSTGVLVAEFDRKFTFKTTNGSSPFEEKINLKDDCWKVVSNLDLALGIQYQLCNFCCTEWAISLGYEFHHWINTPGLLTYISGDTSDESHLDHNNEDLGFDGFFLRLGASF